MDVEQRIGRIHRYGQTHTAQVYNLVSADTIEGQIYLLLEEKLLEIGKALGKVDAYGQVTEDLRGQILGQLSERLSYDRLYQEAIRDPKLVRTREELEVAVENARTAREVVFELFQELDSFRLDDYQEFDDDGRGMQRLRQYLHAGIEAAGGSIDTLNETKFRVRLNGHPECVISTDREDAIADESLSLLGLEDSLVRELMEQHRKLSSGDRGFLCRVPDNQIPAGALSMWHIRIQGEGGQYHQRITSIGIDAEGQRSRLHERIAETIQGLDRGETSVFPDEQRRALVGSIIPDMIQRELSHKGLLSSGASFSSRLLAWIEIAPHIAQ